MTICNRIKELRIKKGLSQKEFAKAFSDFVKDDKNIKSVSYATISRWEHGENEPKTETWNKLSEYFHVPVSYLRGRGLSQNDVIWFLMYVYVNRYNDDFELPSGIYSYCGKIGKYGVEKESFEDFDNEDIPGFTKKAKDYLVEYKSDEIINDLLLNYYDGDNDVVVGNDEIKNYVNDEFESLVKKYLSKDDLSTIRSEALSELKDDDIDLPSILERIVSKKLLNQLNLVGFGDEVTQKSDGLNINYLKTNVSESLFKQVEDEVINKIKALSDYGFLSNIGEDFYSTGISPEYEIAKKISDDLKLKDFRNRQEYFKHDPYKASEETISNLSIPASDKSSLVDIFTYLINENEKLKERIDELDERVSSDGFDEESNKDYRGYR